MEVYFGIGVFAVLTYFMRASCVRLCVRVRVLYIFINPTLVVIYNFHSTFSRRFSLLKVNVVERSDGN